MPRESDKRERLVDAAREVIYRRGYAGTTIADVAEESGVPLGNVYYYFKTKEDLGRAVIDWRVEELRARLDSASKAPDPLSRLTRLLREQLKLADDIARSGCPHGTLVQELEKEGGELAAYARRPLEIKYNWIHSQMKDAGLGNAARGAAEHMLASIQGTTTLTHSFSDPKLMKRGFRRLEQWIHEQLEAA